MKHIILLLFVAVIAFSSCENLEENTTVIQADVDSLFFKSLDANGSRFEDGSVTLQGITDNQILTLHTKSISKGSFLLGGTRPNYATFEDENGNVYLTNPFGSGEIIITDNCNSCGLLSGTFKFVAVLPGLDTIYIDKGVFFEVPYAVPGDVDNPNAGTFNAQVNTAPFTPVSVSAVDSGNSLLISGATSLNTIIIRVPITVEVGNYTLPQAGFQASYAVGAMSQNATIGNISVITHNTTAKTISGSFSFVTDEYTITEGQFNVTYD